jgi:hypothetical protein
MVTYPIKVARKHGGSDARKRAKVVEQNRIAVELEKYINAKVQAQQGPSCIYLYALIAHDTGYDVETVRDLCFSIDCGHNGFTVTKPDLDRQAGNISPSEKH